MADYKALAQTIIDSVGGVQNVRGFTLADPKLADTATLEKTDGVIKVIEAGGQYQVVVGSKVTSLYDTITEAYGIQGDGEVEPAPGEDDGKDNAVSRLLGIMSSILMPTLPVLTGAGIIKGLVSLFASLGILSTDSGVYMIFYAVGDGFFYFLPIMPGYTAAKRFKCNEFIGATIGAALTYPLMVNIATTLPVAGALFGGTPFEMDYYNTFFGIPVIMPGSGYTSSVIPIMAAVWFASILEQAFKKHLNEMVRDLLTPLFMLAISVSVTYLVIGPVIQGICGVIFLLISALFNAGIIGGLVGGAIIGALKGKIYVFGGSGLFGLANYVDPTGDPTSFIHCLIGILVAMDAVFIIQRIAYDFDAEKKVIGE